MNREPYGPYAIDKFRKYSRITAKEGSVKNYRQRLWDEAMMEQRLMEERIKNGTANPSEAAMIRAEAELEKRAREFADLEAVEATIGVIENMRGGRDMMRAFTLVYLDDSEKDLNWGDISDRIHQASLRIHADERTIYRWLKDARRTFAEFRGLSTDNS